MRRNGLGSLLFIVVTTAVLMGVTLASGNSPLLGLDLQGGVSVVYEPADEVDDEALSQAISIIRRRVDALGVAEPEIGRQGDAIVVQLPGVKDPDEALEVIGQTAELRFRPVLQEGLVDLGSLGLDPEGQPIEPTVPGEPTEPADPTATSAPPPEEPDETTDTTVAGDDETGAAPAEEPAPLFARRAAGPTTTPPTTASPTTEPAPAGEPSEPDLGDIPPELLDQLGGGDTELTPPEEDLPDQQVVLESIDGERLRLGPALLTGEALSTARAELSGVGNAEWTVAVEMRGGADGIDAFNAVSTQCFNRAPTCPTARLAIVLDGKVQSAPTIQTPTFEADSIQITGNFTEDEAKDLALVLKFGALPVELVPQQTQSVSATLGRDALDAGVTAGLVGLALVAIYMLVYYRLLGLVAMLSLALSASILWVIIAYLGESRGLALTLAGVTGIIVSIGVAVDSNVVFYEHLKENVTRGRTLRSSVDGSFASAFSTIVKADVASLIGAGVLWWLTVGPVRGFAFYLGLSVLIDLVSSYFFMRPLTVILAKSPRLTGRNRLFGLPEAPEPEAAT